MSQTYVNLRYSPIRLGPQLQSGSGGEGAVFEVVGCPNWVAKIYHPGCAPSSSDKLFCMVTGATNDLFKIAAWPFDTLHATCPTDPILGFLMPRIVGHISIHKFYRLEDRLANFPEADWRLLADAALNCAAAFEVIHQGGSLVGDVNERNTLINPDGNIALVDCDSFQIRSPQGRVFRCMVGVPEFTPPELQGLVPADFDRYENHDRFGLALLIFQLLLSRHPYAGINFDLTTPDLPQSIRENRFAYTRNKNLAQSEPPEGAPTLDLLPFSLAMLFERAFNPPPPGHTVGPPPPGFERPSAREWRAALQEFRDQLNPCGTYRTHWFHPVSASCPWCDLGVRQRSVWFNELPVLQPQPVSLPIPLLPGPIVDGLSSLLSTACWFAFAALLLWMIVAILGRRSQEKPTVSVPAASVANPFVPYSDPAPSELDSYQVGPPMHDTIPELIKLLTSPVTERREFARNELRAIDPHWTVSPEAKQSMPAVFAIWDKSPDPMVRSSASIVMDMIEPDWFMNRVQRPAQQKFEAGRRQRK